MSSAGFRRTGPSASSVLIVFLLQWGYFALFEAFGNGRTPGKRVAKIRVIHQSGRGISFIESLARNLVRFVDYLPGFYAVGVVAIFVSRRHQRLGDMVAGTLVVRDRYDRIAALERGRARAPLPAPAFARLAIPPGASTRTQSMGVRRTCRLCCRLRRWPSFGDPISKSWKASLRAGSTWTWPRAAPLPGASPRPCAPSRGWTIPPDTSVETFLEAVAHQLRELGRMSLMQPDRPMRDGLRFSKRRKRDLSRVLRRGARRSSSGMTSGERLAAIVRAMG